MSSNQTYLRTKGKGNKIKISKEKFSQIISDYYQKKYNLNVVFEFLPVYYEYVDETHLLYGYNSERNMNLPERKKVNSYVPCLIKKSEYEYLKKYKIVISGIIKHEQLNSEIEKILPSGIRKITNDEIRDIFNHNGLTHPFYDWFQNPRTNEIEYSVIVTKIDPNSKIKILEK